MSDSLGGIDPNGVKVSGRAKNPSLDKLPNAASALGQSESSMGDLANLIENLKGRPATYVTTNA